MAVKRSDADIDNLLLDTWGTGRSQIVQYVWLILQNFPWAFHFLAIVVVGFVPDFACIPPDDPTGNYINVTKSPKYGQECLWYNASSNSSQSCERDYQYMYAEPKHVSIVSEWDLTCGQAVLSDMSQTILTVGVTVGSAIFPPLSDRFGRKKTFLICHFLLVVVSLVTSFVPNITVFIVSRGILGALLYGCGLVSFVLMLELFPPKYRTNGGLVDGVFWAVAVLSLAGVGYLMREYSWRHVQFVFTASSLIVIFQFLFVEESLRWLILNDRKKEAIQLIRKLAKINKISDEKRDAVLSNHFLSENMKLHANVSGFITGDRNKLHITDDKLSGEVRTHEEPVTESTGKIIDIFRHPKLRQRSLIIFFAWITNSLTYYGLFMMSSSLAGDRHINLCLNAAVEVPAALINFPLLKRFGRRWCCIVFHMLAAIALILAVVLHKTTDGDTGETAVKAVVILGKFFITCSFAVIYIYTPELFPTNIRASGFGMASVASRIGGLVAPFSATVARAVPWLPGAVFGGFCFLTSLLSILLPETGNKDLPQTLADLDLPDKPDKSDKDIAEAKYVVRADSSLDSCHISAVGELSNVSTTITDTDP